MSINGALSNALSGLNVTSRKVELTSNNVANALTEGYARRELEVAARNLGSEGQGVRVTGVRRIVDMALLQDRRLADAATGYQETRVSFFRQLGNVLGDTGDGSLLGRIARLESSLLEAASRPESTLRLQDVLSSAKALASSLNSASEAVQTARTQADASIAAQVTTLNETLAKVKDLNTQITSIRSVGRDTSALEDERQRVVDSIASIVPLRQVEREHGQIALFTTGGAALLDGRATSLEFSATPFVGAGATLDDPLSPLILNGRPVTMSGEGSMFAGGSLAAAFAVRDDLGPAEQRRLDAVARDLIDRLQAADDSLGEAPGLFTDAGNALDLQKVIGLAGRISVNAAVDPNAEGGELGRLRSGLLETEGAPGDAKLLNALAAALTERRPDAEGVFAGNFSFAGLAGQAVSSLSASLVSADQEASFSAANRDELRALELADGVDTDQEMEHLLLLQQAYAANAKVISACDKLIGYLLEM